MAEEIYIFDENNLLPLELLLKEIANSKKHQFPYNDGTGRFDVYYNAKKYLYQNYFKGIDLAASATVPNTVFTKHGIPHIDDLIEHAGHLLQIDNKTDFENSPISGFEVFLLLMSILFHDIGMIAGRDGHEKTCDSIIMTELGNLNLDIIEAKIISSIAQAHSGMYEGGRDTLVALSADDKHCSARYNRKMIAALVRFADELSDNKKRANPCPKDNGNNYDKSKVCNDYCRVINSVHFDHQSRTVRINYAFSVEVANRTYSGFGEDENDINFIDYIIGRILKMDCERIYCNRHFAGKLYIESINAHFYIYKLEKNGLNKPIVDAPIDIGEKGYPVDSKLSDPEIKKLFSAIALAKINEVAI